MFPPIHPTFGSKFHRASNPKMIHSGVVQKTINSLNSPERLRGHSRLYVRREMFAIPQT